MSEASCSGFEPQTYLRDRCKKCFRLRSKHEEAQSIPAAPSSPTTSLSPNSLRERGRDKRRSWRDKMANGRDNGGPEHTHDGNEDDTTSCTSYKSATSRGLSSAKSVESIGSNQDTRSMVTAISESIADDERAATPIEPEQFQDASLMKSEIERLKEEVSKLKEERQNWTIRRSKNVPEADQSLVEMLEERLAEAESCIQDYRDENTVLKCELRDIQECGAMLPEGSESAKLLEKLKANETLCEELMEENETLKADVKDLQQEIEEMQDQYREEEIDEFRELQRELEQNAKNCRILQFKLRKSERQREQLEAEQKHLEAKVKDLLQASSAKGGDQTPAAIKQSDGIRIRELESELRIAKEVSVRLHNELEAAEEKRYKLEDDVFYMKEKVRELQTQTKWREARNKAEQQAKRVSADLSLSINEADMGKEMRDVLEREADLRDQLKFAEEDLKRTQLRMQDLENENEELLRKLSRLSTSKRPPMTRSASEGHAQIQLELAEHEVEHLSTKVERLEKKNVHLAKKILEMEMDSRKSSRDEAGDAGSNRVIAPVNFDIPPEMQRDMSKMMATISDLERKNMELNLQVKHQNEVNNSQTSDTALAELRIEREHKRMITNELNELKKMMLQSDNKKLVSMATKVEVLNTKLALANDRCAHIHRKMQKDTGDESNSYLELLKSRCEDLEAQLSEQKAKALVSELQADTATTDEIEQCCEVLASVETQTNRICKQIEKIDNAQKDERRRSLSKDSSATIIAELASVMAELKNVHQLLEAHKLNNPSYARKSPVKELLAKSVEPTPCSKCKESESLVESQKEEITFYKKKNKDLTNQILQTEDRWTVEIDKQRQMFEREVRSLQTKLESVEKCVEEQNQLIDARTSALAEKTRMIQERDEKCEKLKNELQDLKKEIQVIEIDHKASKEYEIKYKKLESIYSNEREKFAQERTKTKAEMTALKKRSDDTLADLEKLKNVYSKKEQIWTEERHHMEEENNVLKAQLAARRKDSDEEEPIYATISNVRDEKKLQRKESERTNIAELRKQLSALETKNTELSVELGKLRLENEDLQSELSKTQQNWSRDKDNLQHKVRQDEKIRNVELDALQQKFAIRMKIMEDTNKSLHTQLVQARRERDYNREALCTYERKVEDEQQRIEKEEKRQADLSQKCADMTKQVALLEAEVNRLTTDLKLTKDAHKADEDMWAVERNHLQAKRLTENAVNSSASTLKGAKITESALQAAETVRKEYSEYQKFYTKEVDRLNSRIKELTNDALTKQNESQKTTKDLREQIKVLEIAQRNLMQARDIQTGAKEILETEIEKLQETVHLSEVQRLTRKYKISSIIDQLQLLSDPSRKMSRFELDSPDMMKYIIAQLKGIREEDNQSSQFASENSDPCTSMASTSNNLGERLGPIGSDSDATSLIQSDVASQSSVSMKSYQYNTLPVTTFKWSTLHSATVTPSHASSLENNSTWESQWGGLSGRDKDKAVEYDKDGRLHYIPKSLSRSTSYDRQKGDDTATSVTGDANSLNDADDANAKSVHSRASSTGTNILYKVRREELARGVPPSVRTMAKAFDSMDASGAKPLNSSKRSLFSIRKSRSVETTETGRSIGAAAKSILTPGAPSPVAVTVLGRNTSLSQIEELMGSQSPFAYTLPRGSRNPFKTIGTRLVERVRRSLSRSSTGRGSKDSDSNKGDPEPKPKEQSPSPVPEVPSPVTDKKPPSAPKSGVGVSPTPVTTPKRVVKKKVKRAVTTNLAEFATKS